MKLKALTLALTAAAALSHEHHSHLELDKVVVSASGFEQEADSNIRAVQVVSGEELRQRSYTSLEQALQRVAGVSFVNTGTGRSIDLRGQGTKANVAVKVLVDGKMINVLDNSHGYTPLNAVNIANIDRIEIIPGGGAVLYGSGTRGGVINIITKKQTEDGGSVGLSASSYGYGEFSYNADANFAHRFSPYFALNLNFEDFNTKGYQEGDFEDGNHLNTKLFFDITEDTQLNFAYDFYKARVATSGAVGFYDLQRSRRAKGGASEEVEIRRHDLSGEFNHKFANSAQLSVGGFLQNQKINYLTGSAVEGKRSGFEDKIYGANAKVKFDFSNNSYAVVGYEGKRHEGFRKSRALESVTMGNTTAGYTMKTDIEMQKDSHSLFALASHEIGGGFGLSGGARYERATYSGSRKVLHTLSLPMMTRDVVNSNLEITNKATNNYAFELTPRFAYSPSGMVYVKYERGFISPTPAQMTNKAKPLTPLGSGAYYAAELDAEVFDTFEVGVSDELTHGAMFNANVFYTLSTDEIAYIGNPHATGSGWWKYYNIDQTRRVGVEIGAQEELLGGKLQLTQSLTYLNARVSKGVNEGQKVPFVPDFKATLGAEFALSKKFAVFADATYYSRAKDAGRSDSETGKITDQHYIKEYTLIDIGARVTHHQMEFLLGVRNLFNTEYYLSQSSVAEGHLTDEYYIGSGRNFYLAMKYKF